MFDRVSAIARGERKQGREKENWNECFALLPISVDQKLIGKGRRGAGSREWSREENALTWVKNDILVNLGS